MIDLQAHDLGMPLRDRFAYQAMNGLLTFRGTDRKPLILGRNAYELADAMLRARGPNAPSTAQLRDRIAELAMNGLLHAEGTSVKPQKTAEMAYEIADALLAARQEKPN